MNFRQLDKSQPQVQDYVPVISHDPNAIVLNDYSRLKNYQESELKGFKDRIYELEKQLDSERQKSRDLEMKNIESSIEKKYLEKENESKSGLGAIATPEIITTLIGSIPQIIESFKGQPAATVSEDDKRLSDWYKNLNSQEQRVFHLFRNVLKDNALQVVEQTLYKIKLQNIKTVQNDNS